MAFEKLKVGKTGWKKLDAIIESFETRLNAITPLPSETTELSERPDGVQQLFKGATAGGGAEEGTAGGGGSGTPVNVYGAYNASAAIFHLLQSSPPTEL